MIVCLVLIVAGLLALFLMVARVLEYGLVLSFSAHFSSLVGSLLAVYETFNDVNCEAGMISDRLHWQIAIGYRCFLTKHSH